MRSALYPILFGPYRYSIDWAASRLTSPSAGALVADYWFDEGAGQTVKDHVGSKHIDLTVPTTPNVKRTRQGIRTTNGLVQTPSLTNVRTVACLYRVPVNATAAFVISGGTATNTGLLSNSPTAGYSYWLGQQRGVRSVSFPSPQLAITDFLTAYTRGHWCVAFVEFDAQHTTPLGFGGRYNFTSSRFAQYDIAYAAAYSGQLNDADRAQIYLAMRQMAVSRGFIIDWQDGIATDHIILAGQSNADGRGLISALSGAYQARTQPVGIEMFQGLLSQTADQLVMGTNQSFVSPATGFGPQMGFAWKCEDNGRSAHITQLGVAGMGIAIDSGGAGSSWNVAQSPFSSNCHFYNLVKFCWRHDAIALAAGIGLRTKGIIWIHGETDASSAVDGAAWEANVEDLVTALRAHTLLPTTPLVLGKTAASYPGYDATGIADVRAAEADMAANLANTLLINCDDLALNVDLLHYAASGAKTLGERIYDAVM